EKEWHGNLRRQKRCRRRARVTTGRGVGESFREVNHINGGSRRRKPRELSDSPGAVRKRGSRPGAINDNGDHGASMVAVRYLPNEFLAHEHTAVDVAAERVVLVVEVGGNVGGERV